MVYCVRARMGTGVKGVSGVGESGSGEGVSVEVGVNVGMGVEVRVKVTGPKGVGSGALGSRVSRRKGALKGRVGVAGAAGVAQAERRKQAKMKDER
jgi:hypothetical protein